MSYREWIFRISANRRIYEILSSMPNDIIIGNKKKAEQTAGKVANAALENRISFFGPPDIILTGKDSSFSGSEFP